jgi:hypothetical protein
MSVMQASWAINNLIAHSVENQHRFGSIGACEGLADVLKAHGPANAPAAKAVGIICTCTCYL